MSAQRPILLCVAGFDPSGGAGLQADIETAAALGVRTVCALSCNTLQDSVGAYSVVATPSQLLARQIKQLLADFDIAAVKTGLIPSAESVKCVAQSLATLRCPIVADPVLHDGTGHALCDDGVVTLMREVLLPLATCATPNRAELAALVPDSESPAVAARTLLDEQCAAVLVTSEACEEQTLEHALYLPDSVRQSFSVPRLAGEFHGSGCTLSSALAAQLALGKPLSEAVPLALRFTVATLERADALGRQVRSRRFPRRL